MNLSKLRIVLEAVTAPFNRAMRAARGVVGRMTDSVKRLTSGMNLLKVAAAAAFLFFTGAQIARAAKGIFDIAAAVEETQSKFSTVFGQSTAAVQEFLDEYANVAGLANQVAQDMTASTGALLQGLNFTQEASAELSEQVLRMAGDFASFNNLRTEDTLAAITSALVGEREQMKRLSVVLNEKMVGERAAKIASEALTTQTLLESKALATLELVAEKAAVQMGDLERTQESAQNRAKNLGAQWADLRDTAATLLLPMFNSILEAVSNNRLAFEQWEDELKENAATIIAWTAVVAKGFEIVVRAIALPIKAAFNLGQTITELGNLIVSKLAGDIQGANTALENMARNWSQVEKGLGGVSLGMVDFMKLWNEAMTTFLTGGEAAVAATRTMTFGMTTLIEEVDRTDAALVNFTSDFATRVGRATTEGAKAFDGFFTSVLQGLARLAAEMAIFDILSNVFKDSSFVGALGSRLGIPAGGGGSAGGGDLSGFGGFVPGFVPAGATSNFRQEINFNIAALDAPGVAKLLQQNGGTIQQIIADGARQSSGFRSQLRGR